MNYEFLEEEIRNDYLISKKMKKVFKLQIEMLEEVKRICKKHNIIFLADSGTLLGAVRHQGYIPWDDDIDIGMTRDMYNRFISVAQSELNERFFLQTTATENNHFCPHAQIRCNDTTMLVKDDFQKKHNRGVFIDIFVYDKLPIDLKLDKKLRKKLWIRKKMLYIHMLNYLDGSKPKYILKKMLSKVYLILNGGFKKVAADYDKLASTYQNLEHDYYYDQVSYYTNEVIHKFPADINENVKELKFEFTTISVPNNYDKILKELYGDNYMTPLKAPTDHGHLFIDLDNSYKKYNDLSNKDYLKLFENN